MPHDQRETPYLDAALRYRATGYTPFHTPGHKLGKGAPAGMREFMGDARALRGPRHGRRRGGHA